MTAEDLLVRHERLCFRRAFPRSAAELRRTLHELDGFERRARRHRDELVNTGIAGTAYHYPFNHTMARWLSRSYGRAVEIDWPAYQRHTWDEIAAMLSLCVAWSETEGLDDDDVPSWDWVRWAKGGDRRTDLAWLLDTLHERGFPLQLERHLFEGLSLPLRWDLSRCRDAVTHARLPVRRVFYHRKLLREWPADFAAEVRKPIGPLETLAPARADHVIHAARAALSQREREFHVIVHANGDEVYRVEAGRGLEIYVIGLARPERLTLESDFGALLVKNGVPLGYGYAVLLGDRADIAINIFPTYRAGESPYVFARFASVFHHHFGARKFLMRRYQLGHQNPEGIEAGSFWFYYKLGFRSLDAKVREGAEAEAERLARRKGARSDAATLRRLARSDMLITTDDTPVNDFRDVEVKRVGLAVTRMIERRYRGDRASALADIARRVAKALGAARVPERMAPVVALIPDLARWSERDRRGLLALLRAKEGRRERPYVFALQRAVRFLAFIGRRSAVG
ncbi:MAG: hypothetical protein HYR48_01815 [Gemmatimonadetes bacterium]|nr:hypothetical protein [Gemmatimonadota bacterium]